MLYVNKYSHAYINTYIYIYIVCIKYFSKTKCQVSNLISKMLTFELKLKWVTLLWKGGAECLTPNF